MFRWLIEQIVKNKIDEMDRDGTIDRIFKAPYADAIERELKLSKYKDMPMEKRAELLKMARIARQQSTNGR